VRAFGEKALEPRYGLRRRIRLGDANDIEAAGACLLGERGLDLAGIAQKSRSA
jgi:hypothetical protein